MRRSRLRKQLERKKKKTHFPPRPNFPKKKKTHSNSLLRKTDYICSTYRDHVHALSKNVPAREIMAELFGKKTGICRGQGG